MAARVILILKNDTKITLESDRPGVTADNTITILNGFVMLRDVWGEETYYPNDSIKMIRRVPEPQGRW